MIRNVKTVRRGAGRYFAIIKVKENEDWCKGCYLAYNRDCNLECRSAGGKFRKIKDGELLKMDDGTIKRFVILKNGCFELKEVAE